MMGWSQRPFPYSQGIEEDTHRQCEQFPLTAEIPNYRVITPITNLFSLEAKANFFQDI